MMKKYFEHMQTKSPHERRQHALRVATGVTAIIFVGWVATLGVRMSLHSDAQTARNGNGAQTAGVANSTTLGNTLEAVQGGSGY